VYSPADRLQPHRYKADEAYCVGTADMQPVSCYLDMVRRGGGLLHGLEQEALLAGPVPGPAPPPTHATHTRTRTHAIRRTPS
jgi:hypothetical protein